MPFCGNCGAEVPAGSAYCPVCGFQGIVAERPPAVPGPPPVAQTAGGAAATHVSRLSWGVILLTAWMGLLAWAGLQNAFFPPPPTAPVYLVDMSAPELAVSGIILLLPVACFLLLGLGLWGLRRDVREVRESLTWRIGPLVLGPLRVVGVVFLLALVAVVASVTFAAVAHFGGGDLPGSSLLTDAAFEALLIGLGWCLMVFSAKAIRPWAGRREAASLAWAVIVISAAAMFEACLQFVAAGVALSNFSATPGATSLPTFPWADGASATAAVAGLLVVAWVARRIVHRMTRSTLEATPVPA